MKQDYNPNDLKANKNNYFNIAYKILLYLKYYFNRFLSIFLTTYKTGNPIITIPANNNTPAGSLNNSLTKTKIPPAIATIGTNG